MCVNELHLLFKSYLGHCYTSHKVWIGKTVVVIGIQVNIGGLNLLSSKIITNVTSLFEKNYIFFQGVSVSLFVFRYVVLMKYCC